jgi:hypothetical protein
MTLDIEDSVAGFLGVHIERNQSDGSIKLTQVSLIKRIIAALGIENDPAVHTPTSVPNVHASSWTILKHEVLAGSSNTSHQ